LFAVNTSIFTIHITCSECIHNVLTKRGTEELWCSRIVNLKLKILYLGVMFCFVSSFLHLPTIFQPFGYHMQIHCCLHCSLLHWQMFAVGIFHIVHLMCLGVVQSCTSLVISKVLKLICFLFFRMSLIIGCVYFKSDGLSVNTFCLL
jgi:hypothetical protein